MKNNLIWQIPPVEFFNKAGRLIKWLKIKFTEFQKLIKSIKYLGIFSPLVRFRTSQLLCYSFAYPIIKIIYGRNRGYEICESFVKVSLYQKTFSFPHSFKPPIKSKIVLKESKDWGVLSEICINDSYYVDKLEKDMVVVDVGAHIGVYAVIAAEKVGANGKVIAVEPEPKNQKRLIENIKINRFNNIIPVKAALSSRNGTEKLYISRHSTDHSLVNGNGHFVLVAVKTLDKLIEELKLKKVDLIKIDAEGMEMEILNGAENTLKNNPDIKIIVASYHYPSQEKEVQNFFKNKGFKTKNSCFGIVANV